MAFRILIFIVFLCIVLFVVVPFALFSFGINIFSSKTGSVPMAQTIGKTKSESLGILIRSQDGGQSWHNASLSENPGRSFPSAIHAFVPHPKDADTFYMGGTQSGLWKSINGGRTWDQLGDEARVLDSGADIYDIEIMDASPEIIYIAAYQKNRGRILRTDDGGQHFKELYATSGEKKGVFDIVVDTIDKNHLLAVTGEGILIETKNEGKTWRIKKTFMQPLMQLIADPQNTQELYGINEKGEVFKSVTGGNDWSSAIGGQSKNDAPAQGYPVPSIPNIFEIFGGTGKTFNTVFMLDPRNASHVYLAYDTVFLRSQDTGLTWKEIDLLFTKDLLPMTAMAIDPYKSSTLFVAASHELQKTTDDGLTWSSVPLPAGIGVKQLVIHPQDSNIMFAVVGK